MVSLEEMQKFLVEKAIIFPTAEIYGGFAGFFDYGPLGVEIKRAVKDAAWKFFAGREDVVGMDGCIITHPKVWEASGHVETFNDPLVDCTQCKARLRADHVIEDKLKQSVEGLQLDEMSKLIKDKGESGNNHCYQEIENEKCKKHHYTRVRQS